MPKFFRTLSFSQQLIIWQLAIHEWSHHFSFELLTVKTAKISSKTPKSIASFFSCTDNNKGVPRKYDVDGYEHESYDFALAGIQKKSTE